MSEGKAASLSRSFSWADPAPAVAAARTMSGLECLRAMLAGDLPNAPMAATLDLALVEAKNGRVVFGGEPGAFMCNPNGTIHGGFAASLIDSATGCAVYSTLEAGYWFTTMNLSVDFLRPLLPTSGGLRCEGRVVHRGRRTAIAEAQVIGGADGKVYGRGQTNCMIFAPEDSRSRGPVEK